MSTTYLYFFAIWLFEELKKDLFNKKVEKIHLYLELLTAVLGFPQQMFIYKSLFQKGFIANNEHSANSTQQSNQENPGPGEGEHWRKDDGSVQNVSDAVLHTVFSAQK